MQHPYALSIIIPTRNRCTFLRDALDSLKPEVAGDIPAEIIVIDNGSTDSTRDVVTAFAATAACPVVYRYEARPGLHVGRHLGAELAQAPLLAYLDDDVIVQPGWLRAVVERFDSDASIALVGGPCRPRWEVPPPAWIDAFREECLGGWCLGQLSLLDLGSEAKDIPAAYVFGCNYCIRKNLLYKFGGFNPDGMPIHLSKYRGNGESGLSLAIENSDYRITYDPKAAIDHRVPAERVTINYFRFIAYRVGISVAYSTLRQSKAVKPCIMAVHTRLFIVSAIQSILLHHACRINKHLFRRYVYNNYHATLHYSLLRHIFRYILNKQIRIWTNQDSYFNIEKLPYK